MLNYGKVFHISKKEKKKKALLLDLCVVPCTPSFLACILFIIELFVLVRVVLASFRSFALLV